MFLKITLTNGLMSNISLVHPALAIALNKKGYKTLTPVQDAVLAPDLQDRDLLVSAQTGSGKTVAFGLTLASTLLGDDQRLPRANLPLALCIAPTRELALQVKRELDWLYRDAGVKTVSCVGGMDARTERNSLQRGAHIVVGTPGRLCDHIRRGALDLSGLQAVVLDEADEMLNMGFREELEMILNAAPENRRTLMFSATVPKSILGMTRKYQRDAVRVNTAAEAKQHLDIDYKAMNVASSDRENAIVNVLRFYDAKNAIVFADTRVAVNRMVQRFNNRGFSVVALSGELSQAERSNALQSLREGRAKVCVATDVAARGLDLPDLELVIHADVPRNRESLLHRSGRTGRAGRKGVSALIVAPNRRRNAERLLRDAGITADWTEAPSADAIRAKDNERLLADMDLDPDITEEERELAAQLTATHSPEHIATALIRQYRSGQSAPEDLHPVNYKSGKGGKDHQNPKARSKQRREDFTDGVWVSLNVGRKQNAEPKWILPMLLKSGGLKKPDIGNIKIVDRQTFVELAPASVNAFMDRIGPDRKIEPAITVSPIEGKPDFSQPHSHQPRSHQPHSHQSRSDSQPEREPKERKASKPRKHDKHGTPEKAAPPRMSDAGNAVMMRKPRKTPASGPQVSGALAPKAKKPHKKKLARAAALQAKEAAKSKRKSKSKKRR